MECRLIAPGNVLDQAGHKVFGDVHDIIDVGVCHVEFARRKFGVVRQIDTLIPEQPTQLIHALESADYEHFKVELWRHAHEEVHIEVVVVRYKRLGRCAACDRVHHRRLDLDKIPLIKVSSDIGDHLGPGEEDVARIVVHDQIEIALPVPLLLIFEAVMLRGDLVETWGKEDDLPCKYREFPIRSVPGCCPAWVSDYADDIASPQVLVLLLERDIPGCLLGLTHDLDLDPLGSDVVEDQLGARCTFGVDPASQTDLDILEVLASLERLISRQKLSQIGGNLEFVRVGVGCLALP